MKRVFACFIALIFASIVLGGDTAKGETSYRAEAKKVARKLSCPCGCGKMLVDSGSAERELARIETLLAEGKTEDEIIKIYVAEYGSWILSAPSARGFHAAVWALPFLGVIAGLFLLWIALKRLTDAKSPPTESEPKSADLAEAEKELERFDF